MLNKNKELSCTEIGERLNFSGSALSHHLKQLQDSGVLEFARKEGTYHYYHLNWDTLKRYIVVNSEI
ncbi:helix-turn-helix domain-containing protein [Bacillus gobiensis]|uniref:ArsR/SmtB family transcription factor n=1 Tax=Bacillus gobiensis TaxID=1441095 RepID=UPI003D199951